MPYIIIALVTFTLFSINMVYAAKPEHAVLEPPIWLQTTPKLAPLTSTQELQFDAKQHQYLWLPEGHWLEINPDLLNQFIISAGNTQYIQQRLQVHRDLLCNSKRCQLPATGHNRIIAIQNHLDESASFRALVGHYQAKRDSFRRALKLAKPSVLLTTQQGNERYYQLHKDEEVTLFFPAAKKLKLSVRQNMQLPDRNGVVYAYVDNVLTAKVNTINSLAVEYSDKNVGLVNSDYLAIDAGQYLTIKSATNSLVKIEQSHRAIYDDGAAAKEQEKQLMPYWLNTANDHLKSIYQEHSLGPLSNTVFSENDPLNVKRYYNLLSMMSIDSQLVGSYRNQLPVESKSETITELAELRLVDHHFYPRINHQTRLLTALSQSAQVFDLTVKERATPWLTLIAKSNNDTQLKFTAGEQSWLVNLKATEHFQTLTLSVPLKEKSLSIQALKNTTEHIDFALYARTLADIPMDEVLYQQPNKLSAKSPTTELIIKNYLHKQHADYLASIEPYTPAQQQLNITDWEQLLMTANDLAESAPLDALRFLKKLSQHSNHQVAEKAWQARIDILRQQKQFHLANSYLEGLYKSAKQAQLQHFASLELIKIYQEQHQDYKLFALCAGNLSSISNCRKILIRLAVKQQKNRLATWLAHQSDQQNIAEPSFAALNFQSLVSNTKQNDPLYHLVTAEQAGLIDGQGKIQNTVLSDKKPWKFTATHPIHLAIKARVAAKQNGEYQTAWLKADSQYQHKLMPIFSDIPANIQFIDNQQLASISATLIISLQVGETLTLSADHMTYLDVSLLPNDLVSQFDYQSDAANNLTAIDFMSLVYSPTASQYDLLINGLYQLSKRRLNDNQYTQLLQRLETLPATARSTFIQNRIESFGQWQPIESMLDYAGTRLFKMQAPAQSSFADRFTLLNTQSASEQGLQLRPFHTLHIDLAQTAGQQIRFKFHFSTAELARDNVANVSLRLANELKTWSVSQQQSVPFTFTKQELDNNIISIRWLNPYLSQYLTIEAEQYLAGKWQHLELPTKLLFYTVIPDTPLIATLSADRLIKLEEIDEQRRTERRFFHPAGKIEVKAEKLEYVRLYSWQLSEHNNKISAYSQTKAALPELITYQAPEKVEIVKEQTELHADELNWQVFARYDQQQIFQSAEDIPTREETDIGARIRINDDNQWYQLEGYYSFSDTQTDIINLNGYYSWEDETTPWYIDSQINSRWQMSREQFDSQYAIDASISIGQIWRQDSVHRHQWQITPYVRYSSADLADYLADDKLNSGIFNFYRENHSSGWLGLYQYRYQPWVDNYLNFGVSSGSNDDWSSLDYLRFNSSWNQYYEGHIFQVGLDSYYRFADEHRATATWQYISRFAWQKQIDLGGFSQGWLKVSWQQDWVWNNHNISVEFSSGNNLHTGFAPYAHDEIIFPTLQLNHLLELSDYEQ